MLEITSFNQLFVEAARCGLYLQAFYQGFDDLFYACWRTDGLPKENGWIGPTAKHERPFDAALNAFALADLQAPRVEAQTVDLFD